MSNKDAELILYSVITTTTNKDVIAIFLESYVQEYGPVSNECGDKIKKYIAQLS